MLNKYESLLKRFLKNKIKLSTATIVAICIGNNIAYGATAAINPSGNTNSENVVITDATLNPTTVVGEGYIHFSSTSNILNTGNITAEFIGGQYSRNIYGLTTESTYSPSNTLSNSGNITIIANTNQAAKPDGSGWGGLDIRGISTKGSVENSGNINLTLNNFASRTSIAAYGILGSDSQTTGNTINNGEITLTISNTGDILSSTPTSSSAVSTIAGIKGKFVENNKSVTVNVNNSGSIRNNPSGTANFLVSGLQASGTTTNNGVVTVNYNNSGSISGTIPEKVSGIYLTGNASAINNGILDVSYSSNVVGGEAYAIRIEDWNGNISTDESKATNNGIVVISGNVNIDNITNDDGMIYNKDTGIVTSAGSVVAEGTDRNMSADDLNGSQTINKFSLNLTTGVSNNAQINAIAGENALLNVLADQDVTLNGTRILSYSPSSLLKTSDLSALITTQSGSVLTVNDVDFTTSALNAIYAFGDTINIGQNSIVNATYAVKLSDDIFDNTEYRKVSIDSSSQINGKLSGGLNSMDALILKDTTGTDGTISNEVSEFEALVAESGNWKISNVINLNAHNTSVITDSFNADGNITISEGGVLNLAIDADNRYSSSVYANDLQISEGGKLNIDIKGSTLISKETTINLSILNLNQDFSTSDSIQEAMDNSIAAGLISTNIVGSPSWQDSLYNLSYNWSFEDGQLKLNLIQANGPTLVGGYNQSINNYPQSNLNELAMDLIDSTGSKILRNSKIQAMRNGKAQQPIFAEFLGMIGDYTGSSQDYKYSSVGFLVGGAKELTSNLTLGATFGQLSSDVDYKDGANAGTSQKPDIRDSNEDVKTYAFNTYLNYNYKNWLGNVSAGISNNEHDLSRKVIDTDNNAFRELTSNFDSNITKFGVEFGYVKSFGESSFLYPYASYQHLTITRDAYQEKKTEDTYLDLAVKKNKFSTGRGILGLNLQTKYNSWKWSADLAYISNFSERKATDASFIDIGNDVSFSIPELEIGKNNLKASLGFDCEWTEAFSINGAYEFSDNSSYSNNTLSFGAKYTF